MTFEWPRSLSVHEFIALVLKSFDKNTSVRLDGLALHARSIEAQEWRVKDPVPNSDGESVTIYVDPSDDDSDDSSRCFLAAIPQRTTEGEGSKWQYRLVALDKDGLYAWRARA